jgi:16S rRNA (guanine966-N2)-methyltransferase
VYFPKRGEKRKRALAESLNSGLTLKTPQSGVEPESSPSWRSNGAHPVVSELHAFWVSLAPPSGTGSILHVLQFRFVFHFPAMRITGGQAARRVLNVPKGLAVRPTPDLVKQAVFNSLGARVVGARVLELFAGSGALSLECLSRGAGSAVCVEKFSKHADFIRRNASVTGVAADALEVRVQDVFTVLGQLAEAARQFDLILADPPYGEKNVGRRSTSFAQFLLDDPNLPRTLAAGGRFILGHARRDTLEIPPPWRELKLLKHGDSLMRFLECGAQNEET